MNCKKCGNELEDNAKFCKNCGAKVKVEGEKKGGKSVIAFIILAVIIIALAAAVVVLLLGRNNGNNPNSENSTVASNVDDGKKQEPAKIDVNTKEGFGNNSSPSNDTDLGLRLIKIDSTNMNLTKEQQKVMDYFDNDYFSPEYEFMIRYPQVFKGSKLELGGQVYNVIKSDDNDFEVVLWVGKSEHYYEYWDNFRSGVSMSYEEYVEKNKENFVVIKGKQEDAHLIKGDWIQIYGVYNSIDSYNIDGKEYSIPTINIHRKYYLNNDDRLSTMDGTAYKFDQKYVRDVAKAIFNNSVIIREANDTEALTSSTSFANNYAYVCELDNISNNNFGKYFFTLNKGSISDTRNYSPYPFSGNEDITRYIEFAPDFEHFFMFRYEAQMKILTVEYYDKSFNKIWSGEFEDTLIATYDYTVNNIYLVANNYLYTINTKTGEDTVERRFVGEKIMVRKLEDGLLLFGNKPDEAVMKTDLQGNIKWTANLDDYGGYYNVQTLGENIVVKSNEKYYVFNRQSGEKKLTAVSYSE